MFAQARGWVEFWFAWLAVDLVGVPLNFHSGLPFSGLVYIIYFVLVLAGMYAWWQQTRRGQPHRATGPAEHHRRGRSDGMSAVTALQHDWYDAADLVLDPVERAIADIAAGRPVVVVDDENRENEGDLVVAAEKVTPEIVAFMMSECRGLICVPLEGADLDRLDLPQMVDANTESMRTAFTVSVDARRARRDHRHLRRRPRHHHPAARRPAAAAAGDFVRPGTSSRCGPRSGGVLVRPGHTEAGVDLARLAGLRPAAAIVEIAREDGTMARLPDLVPFARKHGLAIISIEDLIAYRRSAEPTVRREADDHAAHRATATSARTATAAPSTASSTSRWSPATSATASDVLVRVHSDA